jgi:leucyl-tRNA synthetase
MKSYDHKAIEQKWQEAWRDARAFETPDHVEGKENEYILFEFPYPSGNLHVGHWYAFALTDIYARFRRLQGKNVLFPIGFDAFGLPAENAAIKHNLNPREWTYQNMDTMRTQLQSMGGTFDWSREVITCDPSYYKWTQYLFLELYKAGLVQKKITTVNWDPVDKTVLANEQVLPDGRAERSGALVEQKELEQWTINITKYADRLLEDVDALNWPTPIKDAQRNWIGKSEGAYITFALANHSETIRVFTTRPDTLFGVTYLVLAPEHALVEQLLPHISNKESAEAYIAQTKRRTERDRLIGDTQKTGVCLEGVFAINPATQEQVPVYIADDVLAGYGTGAIMAVPAHDERDHAFAELFTLPIKEVVTEEGVLINSGSFNGLTSAQAKQQITESVGGELASTYKLRDWIVSRQRYWGCPIPMINCASCGSVPVPAEQLPVVLPDIDDFLPRDDGKSPLAKAVDWMHTNCPSCNGAAERETDTLDTFVDSSWYFLRYTDPQNNTQFADPNKLAAWMPVNFYSGGAEHTTMHLLYARFFHKALFDLGLVPASEPFTQRLNRGLILGTDGNKMSKSKGNVIDPDKEVERLGSDTVRSYLAFIGPYNEPGNYPWDPNGIVGVRRFIERAATITEHIVPQTSETVTRALHQSIKKVTEDTVRLKFNTAIAQLMTLISAILKEGISSEDAKIFMVLLTPFAPHLAEELWQALGGEGFVQAQQWPVYDATLLLSDTIQIAIQINGKVRSHIEMPRESTQAEIEAVALSQEQVIRWLEGKTPKKAIYVPGKVLSLVV